MVVTVSTMDDDAVSSCYSWYWWCVMTCVWMRSNDAGVHEQVMIIDGCDCKYYGWWCC